MNRTMLSIIKTLLSVSIACIFTACATSSDWSQWRGANRDGVWLETGLVEKFDAAQLPIRWRAPISSGYSGPTVADGRVYVTDRITKPQQMERVHCFDWETGLQIWSYHYDCEYRNVGYTAGPRANVLVHEGLAYASGFHGASSLLQRR